MKLDRTQRNLALAAGDELNSWSRKRLDARLSGDKALDGELQELKGLRKAYRRLESFDAADRVGDAARARLRTRIRARVRDAARTEAPARGWLPALSGATLAAVFVVMGLAIVRDSADKVVEPGAHLTEVQVFMTHGADGSVLNWRNGETGARYLVLRGDVGQETEVVAEVCGRSYVVRSEAAERLQSYRVVRLDEERCS